MQPKTDPDNKTQQYKQSQSRSCAYQTLQQQTTKQKTNPATN